jgi:carbamate kinase
MTRKESKDILLVALGGNALIRQGQEGTIAQQMENLRVPVRQIAHLSERYRIIITHGNGPQVGDLMLQLESCQEVHFPAGSMGPKIQAACEFLREGGRRAVICSIEQIERAVEGEAGTVITG